MSDEPDSYTQAAHSTDAPLTQSMFAMMHKVAGGRSDQSATLDCPDCRSENNMRITYFPSRGFLLVRCMTCGAKPIACIAVAK